jgi:hypothetical protein
MELTDEQWARIEPLLPPKRRGQGRPRADDRAVMVLQLPAGGGYTAGRLRGDGSGSGRLSSKAWTSKVGCSGAKPFSMAASSLQKRGSRGRPDEAGQGEQADHSRQGAEVQETRSTDRGRAALCREMEGGAALQLAGELPAFAGPSRSLLLHLSCS